jgi:effector-binding domain-containing protein
MRNLVPIGRFSQLTRLTVKALRLYDELELLRPVQVDPDTGYRYYSMAQTQAARRIRLLRSIEMPLEEIRAVIATRDLAAERDLLERHEQRLVERIKEYQRHLALLHTLMSAKGEAVSYEIKLKEASPQPIASILLHTKQQDLGRVLPPTIDRLFAHLANASQTPAGAPVAIYHSFTEEGVDVEVGVPVSHPVSGEGDIKASELPGGSVACTLHVGPYDDLSAVHDAVYNWTREHGHEVVGPPREAYLTNPRDIQDPAQHQTEVAWPVR